jgi:hypothetical protein
VSPRPHEFQSTLQFAQRVEWRQFQEQFQRDAANDHQQLVQGFTNPGRQPVLGTKFCTVAPNIGGSSVWNLLYVTLLAPRILRWLPGFLDICSPLN